MRHGDWMQTHSGLRFYPLDPRVEDIRLEDIAHALPMVCRFRGHCARFYSVAEHSLLVAGAVFRETHDASLGLAALLHDASEAYLCDIPRPVKHLPEMAAYREVEKTVERVIAERFGLAFPMSGVVKRHDERALMTERRDLVPNAHLSGWTGQVVDPYPESLTTGPGIEEIRDRFLCAFAAYGGRS